MTTQRRCQQNALDKAHRMGGAALIRADLGRGYYRVQGANALYLVRVTGSGLRAEDYTCTCAAGDARSACYHQGAVYIALTANRARALRPSCAA